MKKTSHHLATKYNGLASLYDRRWSHYNSRSYSETLDSFKILVHQKVLDVGCGTGAFLRFIKDNFKNVELVGVDISEGMLKISRERLKGDALFFMASSDRLPFQDRSFDKIISISSFHYWRDSLRSVREMSRILRDDGEIIITDWCSDFLLCRLYDFYLRLFNNGHHKIYTKNQLEQLLIESDLKIAFSKSYKINWFWGMMTVVAQRSD